MPYTRQDQLDVIKAYEEMLQAPDCTASAKRAASRAGVGCSKTTAQRWLKAAGVLQSRKEAIESMWEDKYGDEWERYAVYLRMGYTVKEVAERFEVSRQTVFTAKRRAEGLDEDAAARRHRRAWDPSTPRGQRRQEKVRQMAEKDRNGHTRREIAEQFGISDRHVTCLLNSPLNPYNSRSYDPDETYTR